MKQHITPSPQKLVLHATADQTDMRLDRFIAQALPKHSRTFITKLMADQFVSLNGKPATKPSTPIKADDQITVTIPSPVLKDHKAISANMGVELVRNSKDFLIICKPAGLLVHAPNHLSQAATLIDWLLAHFKEVNHVGAMERPGLVHRLDKDTSGLMIIARNNYAHMKLTDMFRQRTIHKTYLALVRGHPDKQGVIDFPISRDRVHKYKMSHRNPDGRASVTHYNVLEYFNDCALIEAKPVTGRTHQIRVHLAAIGHPLIGDPVYGTPSPLIKRHALHAAGLTFTYDGEYVSLCKPLPDDMQEVIRALRAQKTIDSLV